MTDKSHTSGTDRVLDAANQKGWLSNEIIINVQGDEILILPEDLSRMVEAIFASPENMFWNATATIDSEDELSDSSVSLI